MDIKHPSTVLSRLVALRSVIVAFAPLAFINLVFIDVDFDGVGGVDGLNTATSVAVSPDGSHVYVSAQGDHSVAAFSRNSSSGEVTFVELEVNGVGGVDGIFGASSVAMSPDGAHVYVTDQSFDSVAVFSRNSTTGELNFVEFERNGVGGVDGLDLAISVAVSPDGSHVYVAGNFDDAVAVFSRNSVTGELNFVEVERDGFAGVDGLDGAASVAVSPDGKHVYVAADTDDAVAVFSRNSVTGELNFVEFEKDGLAGVDGLNLANSVAVSPDGKHVYVAGFADDAVAIFSRNTATGALSFKGAVFNGSAGVDGLDGAGSVAVSPDGRHVYVTATLGDAFAAFTRDPVTGALSFQDAVFDGVAGVDGLDAAWFVAVSPDNKHAYVVGRFDHSLAVFLASHLQVFIAD